MSLLTNLISYYKMDEASGNLLDAHGAVTLTENGGPIGTTTGKINGARTYSRPSTQYHDVVAPAAYQSASDWAVSLWFNPTTLIANASIIHGAVTWGTTSDVIFSCGLYNGATNQDLFRLEIQNSGGSYQNVTQTAAVSTGTWYHFVAELNAGTLRVYMNGGGAVTNGFTGTIKVANGTTHRLAVGRDWYGNSSERYSDAWMDEIAIWNRGLTAGEVTQLYGGGTPLPYSSFGDAAAPVVHELGPSGVSGSSRWELKP